MRRSSFITAASILMVLVGEPLAAGSDRPAKPYPTVVLALPDALPDASFRVFRERLAAVANRRSFAELEPLVAREFFWERDFARGFDPGRPAVDNLAAAIRLEHADGSGWQALAALAAEATAEALPARPGIVCAPAPPIYDALAFARMLYEAHGAEFDWTYPRADRTPVRASAEAGAPVIDTIGLHFVRRLGYGPSAKGTTRRSWSRIVTPSGLVGFVAPRDLLSLVSERLCYGQDVVGRWNIAGFIAGAN
jgi:hypothetical protein